MSDEAGVNRGMRNLNISDSNILEEIHSEIVQFAGEELRKCQLSKLLRALHETVNLKEETDFQRLVKAIADKIGPAGSSVSYGCYEGLSAISKVTHYLADLIEDLNHEGDVQRAWMLEQFVWLIDALRTSGWESTDASVMVWRDGSVVSEHFPKQIIFECHCESKNKNFTDTLIQGDLKGIHNTTGTRLVDILNLHVHQNNPTEHIIKTNRLAKKELLADIGPGGFLYCSVELRKKGGGNIVSRRKAIKYPDEQRYGACALTFKLGKVEKLKNNYHLYKLGTKSYRREWSQCILFEKTEQEGRVWKLLDEGTKKFHTVEAVNTTDDKILWDLKYCDASDCKSWTHPTLVFSEPLSLDKIGCRFEIHQCIVDKRCLECRIVLEKRGYVKAKRVPQEGNRLSNLNIPFEIEGNLQSLTVKIKTGKPSFKVQPIVSLYVFAFSVPPSQRKSLRKIQTDNGIFKPKQFRKIESFWERCNNYHYEDWTTDFE
jgi:hypothetical protein